MELIDEIWMAVFHDEESGDELILTYEVTNPRKPNITTIVPAMTINESRISELLPDWVEGAKSIGVDIKVLHFKRDEVQNLDQTAKRSKLH